MHIQVLKYCNYIHVHTYPGLIYYSLQLNKTNNLKPSHSENTYPVQFTSILDQDVKKRCEI